MNRTKTTPTRILWVLFVVLSLAYLPSAWAGKAKRQAKEHATSATISYKLGQFAKALHEYEAAYRLFSAPALLFNIAQCHMGLKNYEKAIYFFETYLADAKTLPTQRLPENLSGRRKTNFRTRRTNLRTRQSGSELGRSG